MNIDNFEEYIEAKILSRGEYYFENDYIEEIEKADDNEYCGVVVGTDEYSVFIKLDDDGNVLEHSCDCPYDWGDICKHEVAMLFQLREVISEGEEVDKGKIYAIKSGLSKLNKGELIDIIVELSKKNKEVKQGIYWELGYRG